jgi:hypothetical protein
VRDFRNISVDLQNTSGHNVILVLHRRNKRSLKNRPNKRQIFGHFFIILSEIFGRSWDPKLGKLFPRNVRSHWHFSFAAFYLSATKLKKKKKESKNSARRLYNFLWPNIKGRKKLKSSFL